MNNPISRLAELGQSVWLDYIDRRLITSGALARLVNEEGLRGVTSNPAIFEKAITGSNDYDDDIRAMSLAGHDPPAIYEALVTSDVRLAADVFRPTFEHLGRTDGFVSLEVSPLLAHDAAATVAEAQRLWATVNRPNVMIKVPATREGLTAIHDLISLGINVNVTLLFGLDRYREVVEAYMTGLEARAARSEPLDVASVASFFLSRIDVLVDAEIAERTRAGKIRPELAEQLRGQVAIASARLAYEIYKEAFGSERFEALRARGARRQRLLWASTGVKDPSYSDVRYVEALIGKDTISTMPLATFDAYRHHGNPEPRLEEEGRLKHSRETLSRLGEAGIDLDQVTQRLEEEAVRKFVEPYDRLLALISERREAALRAAENRAPGPAL